MQLEMGSCNTITIIGFLFFSFEKIFQFDDLEMLKQERTIELTKWDFIENFPSP